MRRKVSFENRHQKCDAVVMEQETFVSTQQMKDALERMVGSRFPVRITLGTGDVIVRYIRGFADQQTDIVLISETSYSLAMKIVEVKEIAVLEFANEKSDGTWFKLSSRSTTKRAKT
jgi:hypothetical protein